MLNIIIGNLSTRYSANLEMCITAVVHRQFVNAVKRLS